MQNVHSKNNVPTKIQKSIQINYTYKYTIQSNRQINWANFKFGLIHKYCSNYMALRRFQTTIGCHTFKADFKTVGVSVKLSNQLDKTGTVQTALRRLHKEIVNLTFQLNCQY